MPLQDFLVDGIRPVVAGAMKVESPKNGKKPVLRMMSFDGSA